MARNSKGDLIDRSLREGWGKPDFRTRVIGPDHKPVFESDVYIQDIRLGFGEGSTKKRAERIAAEEAFKVLEANDFALPDPDEMSEENDYEGSFEGPWPIFPKLLTTCIGVADRRVDKGLQGEEARAAIQDVALGLYKGMLEHLGEVIEVDEDTE